jgi:hypothetical protein
VGEGTVAILDGATAELWTIALLGFGLGDVATTLVGLSAGHLIEVGPFVAPMINQFGIFALLGLKILSFVVAGLLWWVTPRPHAVGVPLGLATLGVLVTGWNSYLLVAFG